VVSLVTQLVAQNSELAVRTAKVETRNAELSTRNSELEKQLEKILDRYKKSEAVSKTQLVLFIDALSRGEAGDVLTDENDPRRDANEQLRKKSGIDDERDDEPKTKQPRKQPKRGPAPPHLPRLENAIAVSPENRPRPRCGKPRTCIGHDITEVIELVPAKVIVREDKREKLARDDCDGELVRAPKTDKVVDGGKYGDALEADILVGKYADGLPLHRQKERYARLGLDMPVSTLVDQVKWSTDLLRPCGVRRSPTASRAT